MTQSTELSLANKCALVTGSARRVGAAIASKLHGSGADVAVHYRGSEQEANDLCRKLNATRPDSAQAFQADLASLDELHSLADAVLGWHGKVDILVNNASTFYPTPLGSITEDDWQDLVGSNLKAPLFLSQALSSSLKESQGCIVNIVDIHASRPLRDHSVYGSAKAGLAMLTRSLAKDLAPDVRVNGVAPGAILWPEDGMSEETQALIVGQIPLARQGTPDDIARAVLFLAGDAPYVTGQILTIDGGRSIGW